MDINDVFIACTEKWAKDELDERINIALDNFDEWISNFEEEEKELLIKLLQNFDYYSHSSIVAIMKELNLKIVKDYGISDADSVISVVRKADGKLNSSYEYWLLHRMVSGFEKGMYYDSINDIDEEEWNNISKVVYVDDCSGTGEQFTKFIKSQKKSFRNKQIILVVIEAVEDAKAYIKNELTTQGLNVEIVAYTTKEKALNNMLEKEKNIFHEISRKQEIRKDFILGFEKAEALMAFYNNTPNDTLGLFWFISNKNNPIFPRELEKKPGWKLSNAEKKKRSRAQYESKCR